MSAADPARSPSADRARSPARRVAAALLVLACLVVAVALQLTHPPALLALLPSPDMHELHPDFDTFRASAVALVHGGDIYDTPAKLRNLNPPLLACCSPVRPARRAAGLPALRGAQPAPGGRRRPGGGPRAAADRRGHRRGRPRGARGVAAARHAAARADLRAAARRAGGRLDRRAPRPPAARGRVLRRHRGAQALARPAAAAPAGAAPVAPGATGFGAAAAASLLGVLVAGPAEWAGVAADRPHRARARHRRQRLAARSGRAPGAAVRGRHRAGAGRARRARLRPSTVPIADGSPRRTANPGSEALSEVSGAGLREADPQPLQPTGRSRAEGAGDAATAARNRVVAQAPPARLGPREQQQRGRARAERRGER